MLELYIDTDACPVKQEILKVAKRHSLRVTFVANSWMRIADQEGVRLVVVGDQFDAADQWIVEHVTRDDIVITTDIPLASLCVRGGARVLAPSGQLYTADNVGGALATRDLMKDLRAEGLVAGGPPPFAARDRSRFLERLEQLVRQLQAARPRPAPPPPP